MAVKYYNVKNRSASRVCYAIPEEHIRRTFAPGETKRVTAEELQKLSWQPGGPELIISFLQISDEKVLKTLNIDAQPEYYMDERQIVDLLKKGSYESFLDCLDFAPIGVIDLLKQQAVKLPLSDYQKKAALKEKTGFDLDRVLANVVADGDTKEEIKNENTTATRSRRRTAPNYNAESKKSADK